MSNKICIGMMRPLWADLKKELTKKTKQLKNGKHLEGCPCGLCWNDTYFVVGRYLGLFSWKELLEDHYLMGHFDTPVYREVE